MCAQYLMCFLELGDLYRIPNSPKKNNEQLQGPYVELVATYTRLKHGLSSILELILFATPLS